MRAERLRELAAGLRQRSRVCADMAEEDDRDEKDVQRLKASAYGHAAETLEALLKEDGENPLAALLVSVVADGWTNELKVYPGKTLILEKVAGLKRIALRVEGVAP